MITYIAFSTSTTISARLLQFSHIICLPIHRVRKQNVPGATKPVPGKVSKSAGRVPKKSVAKAIVVRRFRRENQAVLEEDVELEVN